VSEKYAADVEEARAFRAAVRSYLVCPHCSEQCLDVKRSNTAIVMRCTCCGLRFHCRRADLADSAAKLATEARGDDRLQYQGMADLLAPPGGEGYKAWRRHTQWKDPTLR
jgi:hypothetical protein